MLALLAMAEVLGMSLWFSASAVSAQFRTLWDLTPAETAWLTAAVQLGFVVGTALAAVLNLADLVPSRAYFARSALLGAAVNAALLAAPGLGAGLLCRFFTGFFLAGVYPPTMKMAATWFRTDRGLAIGVVVASLTVGKAMSYLVRSVDVSGISTVLLLASTGAVLAAALVAVGYRDGPHEFPRRAFSWRLVTTVAAHRETRLATGGYLGHMWELYAMWTWVPAFLAASAAERAARVRQGRDLGPIVSGFCSLGVGARLRGELLARGPRRADLGLLRRGRQRAVQRDGDRARTAARRGNGAHHPDVARFLLTMVTIQLVPVLVELIGWRLAFSS